MQIPNILLTGPAEGGGEEDEGIEKGGPWPLAHVGSQEGGGE